MKYENTLSFLKQESGVITTRMMDLLERNNKQATGSLINSIKIKTVVQSNKIIFEPTYKKHGYYVLSGRKPYGMNKSKWPPFQPIYNWVKQKGVLVRGGIKSKPNVKGKLRQLNGKRKLENKKGDNKQELKSLAYAIRANIGIHGIKSFDFLKPWNDRIKSQDFNKKLEQAWAKDIEKELTVVFKQHIV